MKFDCRGATTEAIRFGSSRCRMGVGRLRPHVCDDSDLPAVDIRAAERSSACVSSGLDGQPRGHSQPMGTAGAGVCPGELAHWLTEGEVALPRVA